MKLLTFFTMGFCLAFIFAQETLTPENPTDIFLFGEYWPLLAKSELGNAWGLWAFGAAIGGVSSMGRYIQWNSCVQDITSLLIDAYSAYVYIYRNIDTEEPAYAIFATNSALTFTGRCFNIRCGGNEISLENAFTSSDPTLNPNKQMSVDEHVKVINSIASAIGAGGEHDTTIST